MLLILFFPLDGALILLLAFLSFFHFLLTKLFSSVSKQESYGKRASLIVKTMNSKLKPLTFRKVETVNL
jgi:flagellar biogenesis protein FliO